MSNLDPPPLPRPQQPPLYKQNSWSPDLYREESWLRRKGIHNDRRRRSKSVTDEDVDELKGCIELGFGFDSPEIDRRLSDTLPALGLYYAVNKQYHDTLSKSLCSSPLLSSSSSSLMSISSPSATSSFGEIPSPVGSPGHSILCPGDNPQTVKTRLRQWAQVVACSVRQSSSG